TAAQQVAIGKEIGSGHQHLRRPRPRCGVVVGAHWSSVGSGGEHTLIPRPGGSGAAKKSEFSENPTDQYLCSCRRLWDDIYFSSEPRRARPAVGASSPWYAWGQTTRPGRLGRPVPSQPSAS